MKIKNMSWTNYKGLTDGEIVADGGDVVISGQNGAGKSSIASIIPFVLFGKVTGTLRRYEAGLDVPAGLIHGAEIIFDDGTTLRRELHDAKQGAGTVTKFFIDGDLVKKNIFDAQVMSMTAGGGEILLNPFTFCEMPAKDQRGLLLKRFATTGAKTLLALPENAGLAELFGSKTPGAFIAACREKLRRPTDELKSIPARIEEINRQLKDEPSESEAAKLAAEIENVRGELEKLQQPARPSARSEIDKIQGETVNLEWQQRICERELKAARDSREKLVKRYKQLRTSKPGTCPTCGQKIPQETFLKSRDAELAEVVRDGKQCAKQIAEHEKLLERLTAELKSRYTREAELKAAVELEEKNSKERAEKFAELHKRLGELTEQQTLQKLASKQRERIDALRAQEKTLNAQIAELEGQIARAENFQIELMTATETEINRHFVEVKFKLFDYLKTTGELRPTCEATLNGVPYVALSKGEKLRVALDVFTALQKSFGVELPLIIDDAESYSTLTLSSLPNNQLILLKVTDGELKIEISERGLAA